MEERRHRTPKGGVRSTIAYLDDDWNLVDKDDATQAEITEYDAAGKIVATTVLVRDNAAAESGDVPDETSTPTEDTS